jgi:hypothetical protein
MSRTRKTTAVLCIALVLIAGVIPVLASALGSVVLVPLWLVLPAIITVVVRRHASVSSEQPVSLLVLLDSRAPPSLVVLA